ncbi:MAG: hypothetical protein WC346_18840 [Methanogenium sp.]|jgi:hypothetical protein
MKLNFDNNWRRTLLLTKQSDKDIDKPVEYIKLDSSKLPCSFKKFCEQFSYDYQFDYDLSGNVLWPIRDTISINSLQSSLNKDFPKVASVINKKPSHIHNLSFNDIEEDEFF